MLNSIKFEFPAKSINESLARGVIAMLVGQLNPTVDEINDIKTAVSEAVTNSIVHGYDENGEGKSITIEASLYEDHVNIKVSDNGKGIKDITMAMQPFNTTKPSEERAGMGFTVMQSFMDNLEVKSSPGKGTTITMRKAVGR